MRHHLDQLNQLLQTRRVRIAAGVILLAVIVAVAWSFVPRIPRKPPSIFDSPVDDAFGYLTDEDFSKLSIEERMDFIQGIVKRFGQMSASDSVVASSFFAGLTGPMNEKLVNNARILGKDVLVQGAGEFLALKSDQDRDKYLDQWIVKWVRFADGLDGRGGGRTDEQILDNLGKQAKRDLKRGIVIDEDMAQQVMDFWNRDVSNTASPKEQAQVFQFFPALRQRIISRK